MLVIPEISKFEVIVRELGFKGMKEYARSPLYTVIKRNVLERDQGRCRAFGCTRHEASRISYVTATKFSLLTPFHIFSLCDTHYKMFHIKAPPNSEQISINNVFRGVSGISKRIGMSDLRIGYWFRDQQRSEANLATCRAIRANLSSSFPEEWERVKEVYENYLKE